MQRNGVWMTTAIVGLAWPGAMMAQNQPNETQNQQNKVKSEQLQQDQQKHQDNQAGQDGNREPKFELYRGSELAGKEVRNKKGEKLGNIHELKPKKQGDETVVIFDVSKERLDSAPGFDKAAWPDTANPKWCTDADHYWKDESDRNRAAYHTKRDDTDGDRKKHLANRPDKAKSGATDGDRDTLTEDDERARSADVDRSKGSADASNLEKAGSKERRSEQVAVDTETKRLRRMNAELMERDINDQQNQDLGDVEDIVVDLKSGKIAYILAEFDDDSSILDELKIGNKSEDLYFAIPYESLSMTRDQKGGGDVYMLQVNKDEIMRLPHFSENNWPDMSDPEWNESVHDYYKVRPFWNTDDSRQARAKRDARSVRVD
jgi:sporulation protein YlmC with PRC-barrel domain